MLRCIYITIIPFLFMIASCKDKAVNPNDPPEILPGTRDYEWSIDSVRIYSNDFWGMWGSSPDDIWAVGPGGSLTTTIWHYDGKQWKTDGIGRIISPQCIYGFSKNDVWIAGANGRIWHYDGSQWSENYQHTINGFIGIDFYYLFGLSRNDFYAVGTVWFDNETRRGIILHYNGSRWEQKYLADFNSYFGVVRTDSDGRCVIGCIKQDVKHYSNDTTVFYEFRSNKLKEIYSDADKMIKGGWIGTINGRIMLSNSSGIYKYTGDTLQPVIKYEHRALPGAVVGRNEKDIFVYMESGISHYNGTDFKPIYTIGNGWFYDGLTFSKDIFFLVIKAGSSARYIYHGKMK